MQTYRLCRLRSCMERSRTCRSPWEVWTHAFRAPSAWRRSTGAPGRCGRTPAPSCFGCPEAEVPVEASDDSWVGQNAVAVPAERGDRSAPITALRGHPAQGAGRDPLPDRAADYAALLGSAEIVRQGRSA